MRHTIYVQSDFWIRTLIKQVSKKYSFFIKLPQISHTHKNSKGLNKNENFLDESLPAYKGHGSGILYVSCNDKDKNNTTITPPMYHGA